MIRAQDGAPASPGYALVINADDLGRSAEVNTAILQAFGSGLVSSTSVMANMPAFGEACEQVRAAGLQDHVGVHLNLTQGRAMTLPIRAHGLLSRPDGELAARGHTMWRLSHGEAIAVATELAAQVEAVLAQGITPTHLDSHHHVHAQWPIGSIVVALARRYGVPGVRIARNCGRMSSGLTRTYKMLYNARLQRAGLARTRVFGPAADILMLTRLHGSIEVMVHPELDPGGRLVDCADGASTFDRATSLEEIVGRLRALAQGGSAVPTLSTSTIAGPGSGAHPPS